MIRVTREQMREIDRMSIERYHIPGIVLMENAARAVTDVVLDMIESGAISPDAVIVCGGGNNGGDGLAVARHLHNADIDLTVALCVDADKFRGDALINFNIAAAMKLPICDARKGLPPMAHGVIIDAIFGTGLDRAPGEPFAQIIEQMNATGHPIVAIDVPSGLDCDTGKTHGACIRAARTVTFVAEKIGFDNPAAKEFLGEITVGDIGCPRELIADLEDPAR